MSGPQTPKDGHSDHLPQYNHGRLGHIILICCIATAFIGFIAGIRGEQKNTNQQHNPNHQVTHQQQDQYPLAPRYEMIRNISLVNQTHLKNPKSPPKNEPIQIVVGTAQQKSEALDQRAELRAYQGAPPVIPHKIDQRRAESCMSCHSQGLKLEQVIAPQMSHEYFNNCTQCHVESTNFILNLRSTAALSQNDFTGKTTIAESTRAWEGAPPTMPHATHMRENCISCHGPTGKSGLRSSHPYRQNCTQCHAQSAVLEQRLSHDESSFPLRMKRKPWELPND
ncbi:nitrate reductase cytochrome c-type subunit [Planctomycetota bacterium]|nr:nitrate reductase cytochrome c-type subunit [Planctomycetota bacterium]